KIAQQFPTTNEPSIITDVHLFVSQESGDLIAYDDNDREITRCVVEEWIDNKDEKFYHHITPLLRDVLRANQATIDNMGILKPFSIVLQNEEKEDLSELYLADDDTIIIGGDLMEGLNEDLDSFLTDLLNEKG
ncbi:MAG: hypothetical protein HXN44_07240, partial [Prevotella nanceiensis]|nr:hypothetical protein [Hoylesella nanceiensis]